VRPLSAAINIGLDKAAKAEGNIALPMGAGPRGNPAVLRRLKLKIKPPAMHVTAPRLKPLKLRHG
jgi:hypothetical protein